MSPRLTHVIAVLLLSAAASHAVRPKPAEPAAPAAIPAPAAPVEKGEPVAPYELKNKSKFATADPTGRAPFWPIGWVKPRRLLSRCSIEHAASFAGCSIRSDCSIR